MVPGKNQEMREHGDFYRHRALFVAKSGNEHTGEIEAARQRR